MCMYMNVDDSYFWHIIFSLHTSITSSTTTTSDDEDDDDDDDEEGGNDFEFGSHFSESFVDSTIFYIFSTYLVDFRSLKQFLISE